ncbi:MAG TPA: recombinase family protein [Candidatus Saccharimonadales bacterium]|nr:recombinase family protein [Candidatus Saccharimonadales bacterium]
MDEAAKLQGLLSALSQDNKVKPTYQQIKYGLYARKSTTSEDRQATSIEDQIKDCYEKVITPNDLNIVEVYKESCSAKIAGVRQEFRRLVEDIENGRIDGLIA